MSGFDSYWPRLGGDGVIVLVVGPRPIFALSAFRGGLLRNSTQTPPIYSTQHKVTERRTAIDYAQVLKELNDVHFAKTEKIVLVQDNLNPHTPAALYEAFPASEARRLAEV